MTRTVSLIMGKKEIRDARENILADKTISGRNVGT